MSAPGNLSEQILALPNGAGSVNSAGQTFTPDPYTGTGSYSIPFDLPTGHSGIKPALSLSYSTHAGSGIAGVGWSLGLASISRRIDHGIPTFNDDEDVFTLQGDELLPSGSGLYRQRIEKRFARIQHVKKNGHDLWVVSERDGTRVIYGEHAEHRLFAGPGRIAVWYPSRRIDASGNEIVFNYLRDRSTYEVYLDSIDWAGCYRVQLEYGTRPDPISSARQGFKTLVTKRLEWIGVQVRRTSDGQLHSFKTYTLSYATSSITGRSLLERVTVEGIAPDGTRRTLPSLKFSYSGATRGKRHMITGAVPGRALSDAQLTLVRQSGSGLPDLLETTETGHWLRENLGAGVFGTPRRVSAPPNMILGKDAFISDMTGNGWGDLVAIDGKRVYPGVAGGGWDQALIPELTPSFDLLAADVHLADLSGDGMPDVLRSSSPRWSYFRNLGEGEWAPAASLIDPPPLSLDDDRVHLADISGDGLDDLVYMEPYRVLVWPSLGHGRYGDPYVLRNAPALGNQFDATAIRWADVTGSGQADLLLIKDGAVAVCFNQAGIGLGDPIQIASVPQSSAGHVEPVDLLGSGAAGLLFTDEYHDERSWQYHEVFPEGQPDLLTTIDNGLGATTSIQYGSSADHWITDKAAGTPWRSALPSPQRVVNRITVTDAVTGTVLGTEFKYHHGVYDGDEREFRGFASVEQIDREAPAGDPQPLSQVRVKRWYHTGLDIEVRDEFTALPEGALTDSIPELPWAFRSLRGLSRREEVFALDGDPRPYQVSQTAYEVFAYGRAPGSNHWSFAPLAVGSRTTVLERSSERRTSETFTTYDLHMGKGYGLPTEVREKGWGRAGIFSTRHEQAQQQALERFTRTTYVQRDETESTVEGWDELRYLVNRPARVERYGVETDGDELLSRELYFYDGEAFKGLGYPSGATGIERGLLSCRLVLAFTDDLKAAIYPSGSGMEDAFADCGGYLTNGTDHYLHAERLAYDEHGMIIQSKDPRGGLAQFTYDPTHGLFPIRAEDAAGHPTLLERGEYPFQVVSSRDANGNSTGYTYDPTGLPATRSVQGKLIGGAWQGDPPESPTEIYEYDFSSQPVHITVKQRQEREGRTFDVHRYMDGMGRTIQERHTAEPEAGVDDSRFRVTGWQIFNHKGLVVRAYQPVFAASPDYATGDATTYFIETIYDPLGRPLRVNYPDGTFESTTYHPWVTELRDRNDNASIITTGDARYGTHLSSFADHIGTPTKNYVDAWGRQIAVCEDAGSLGLHVTQSVLDLQDQVLEVYDAREMDFPTWTFNYDLAARQIRSKHATALGTRHSLMDASGNAIWARDAKKVEVDRTFDALSRPLNERSTDGTSTKLRRHWRYADYDESAAAFSDLQSKNLFGRVEEARDADGLRFFEYDWRGLVTRASHRFWDQKDSSGRAWDDPASELWSLGSGWDPEIRSDERDAITSWLQLTGLDDPTTIEVSMSYDAAGRAVATTYPEGISTRTTYNEAGAVAMIECDKGDGKGLEPVVSGVRYNARGQLVSYTHGNGVETTREYDPAIERLLRIATKRPAPSETHFQDLLYDYDPVGNPVKITDQLESDTYTSKGIIPNTRTFGYDARYRLIRATGKWHASARDRLTNVLVPSPDPSEYEAYDLSYAYDPVGNLTRNGEYGSDIIQYKSGRIDLFNGDTSEAGSWTDPTTGNFRYDDNGNTTHTPWLEELAYTHDDQPRFIDLEGGGQVHYLRHADQRVVRLLKKNGVRALGIYLGAFEFHYRQGTTAYSKVVLHVNGQGRHAQVEKVLEDSDPDSLPIFYHHSDHLGSGHVLTNSDASLLSQEEYLPYGRNSDRRDARNRYRFIGVERDEDTWLCMTGPRAHDPIIGRFLQGDPICSINPYCIARVSPLRLRDVSGYDPVPVQELEWGSEAANQVITDSGSSMSEVYAAASSTNTVDLYLNGTQYQVQGIPSASFSERTIDNLNTAYSEYRSNIDVMCLGALEINIGIALGLPAEQSRVPSTKWPLGEKNFDRDTVSRLASRLEKYGAIGGSEAFQPIDDKGKFLRTGESLIEDSSGNRPIVSGFDQSPGEAMLDMAGNEPGYYLFLVSFVSGAHSGLVILDNTSVSSPSFTFRDADISQVEGSVAGIDARLARKNTWTVSAGGAATYPSTMEIWLVLNNR